MFNPHFLKYIFFIRRYKRIKQFTQIYSNFKYLKDKIRFKKSFYIVCSLWLIIID